MRERESERDGTGLDNLRDKMEGVGEWLPAVNSVGGLFLYGLVAYLVMLLVGWFCKEPERPDKLS